VWLQLAQQSWSPHGDLDFLMDITVKRKLFGVFFFIVFSSIMINYKHLMKPLSKMRCSCLYKTKEYRIF
jgi:hypothetical protein